MARRAIYSKPDKDAAELAKKLKEDRKERFDNNLMLWRQKSLDIAYIIRREQSDDDIVRTAHKFFNYMVHGTVVTAT